MKIVQLTPGAGDSFYCENCLRDGALAAALRTIGHDAATVPLYLPLPTGEGSDKEVFFGGVNVFLQQKSALFRKTPRWLDRLFDSPRLLRWAGKKSGMTSAREVGETLLSMLRGEHGRQVKELDRLVDFLATHEKPDIVALSNALLLGMVGRIKAALDVPVVCSLQDEKGYVDALDEPQRGQVWHVIRERARDVDAFIAPSRFYRSAMQRRLELPDERFHVIPNAIDPDPFEPAEAPPSEPAVGYLSQMCRSKGLDTLAEAFILLKASGHHDELKLRVFGGMSGADVSFVEDVRRRVERAGVADDTEFSGDFAEEGKPAFLRSCSAVSVPTRQGEAFGLFLLEALACGVPVVLPEHGAFPELVEATGGGILCRANDPSALAQALESLLLDPRRAAELGRRGRQAVVGKFSLERMAAEVAGVCERLAGLA